jgi:hypothetical protein
MTQLNMTFDDLFDQIRLDQFETSKRSDADPRKSALIGLHDLMWRLTLEMRDGLCEPDEVITALSGYLKERRSSAA